MITLLLLFFPLAAAALVFLTGHKMAARLALGFGIVELVISGLAAFKIFFQKVRMRCMYLNHG